MKNVMITMLMLILVQMSAQNEIETTLLKADQLINYAADNFPSDDTHQMYILIETGSAGISDENRFYLEKGISLLINRLKTEDEIAIGVYGEFHGTLLPYTAVQFKEVILEQVQHLWNGTFATASTDGIDLAYTQAQKNTKENTSSTILMLRGTGMNKKSVGVATSKPVSPMSRNLNETSDRHITTQLEKKEQNATKAANEKKVGGAIVLTALSILPELISIIKD